MSCTKEGRDIAGEGLRVVYEDVEKDTRGNRDAKAKPKNRGGQG